MEVNVKEYSYIDIVRNVYGKDLYYTIQNHLKKERLIKHLKVMEVESR